MRDWYQQEQFRPFSMTHTAVDPERPGALLVHGFTGTPAEMRPLATVLFELGCDADAMLLRGMGPEIGDLNRMTAEVWRSSSLTRWRDHVHRYRRTILMGYSMGGAVALLQAAAHPPDLLILLAPHVRLADRRAFLLPLARHVVKELRQFATLDFDEPAIRVWFSRTLPGLDLDDPAVRYSLRNETSLSMSMLDQFRRMSQQAERAASSIHAPTVIIQGMADTIALPRHSRRLARKLPGLIAYHSISADHMLPFDSFPSWPIVRDLVVRSVAGVVLDTRSGGVE